MPFVTGKMSDGDYGTFGLLLVDTTGDGEAYRRIGLFKYLSSNHDVFDIREEELFVSSPDLPIARAYRKAGIEGESTSLSVGGFSANFTRSWLGLTS